MSLDYMLCPKCKSEDVNKEEDHNLLNLAIGVSIGTSIGVATNQYYLSGAIGTAFYFLDVPLGPDIEYDCRKCHYHW